MTEILTPQLVVPTDEQVRVTACHRSMSDDCTRPMNVTKACSLLMRSLAPVIANDRRHLMSACGNIRRDRIDPIAP